MSATEPKQTVIIGVGNGERADDAAGLLVARELRTRLADDIRVEECEGNMLKLIEAWQDAGQVVLIDAVRTGSPAGTIHRFDARDEGLRDQISTFSTHGIGVADALALAGTLGRLPPRVTLIGIEGECFDISAEMSPAVAEAICDAATRVQQEL